MRKLLCRQWHPGLRKIRQVAVSAQPPESPGNPTRKRRETIMTISITYWIIGLVMAIICHLAAVWALSVAHEPRVRFAGETPARRMRNATRILLSVAFIGPVICLCLGWYSPLILATTWFGWASTKLYRRAKRLTERLAIALEIYMNTIQTSFHWAR